MPLKLLHFIFQKIRQLQRSPLESGLEQGTNNLRSSTAHVLPNQSASIAFSPESSSQAGNSIWQNSGGAIASEEPSWFKPPKPFRDAVETVKRTAQNAGSAVGSAVRRGGQALTEGARSAERQVDRASSAVREANRRIDRADDAVRGGVRDAGRMVDQAKDTLQRGTDRIEQGVQNLSRDLDRIGDTTKDRFNRAGQNLRNIGERVGQADDVIADGVRRIGEGVDRAEGMLREGASRIDNGWDEAREMAGSAWRETGEFAGDAWNETTEAWEDLSGIATRNKDSFAVQAGHTALDVLGMVPVVGAAADVVNAGWYMAEGNEAMAALSLAGAVPLLGDLGTAGKLTARAFSVGSDAVRAANRVDGALSASGRAMAVAGAPLGAVGATQEFSQAANHFAHGNYAHGGLAATNGVLSAMGIGGVGALRSSTPAGRPASTPDRGDTPIAGLPTRGGLTPDDLPLSGFADGANSRPVSPTQNPITRADTPVAGLPTQGGLMSDDLPLSGFANGPTQQLVSPTQQPINRGPISTTPDLASSPFNETTQTNDQDGWVTYQAGAPAMGDRTPNTPAQPVPAQSGLTPGIPGRQNHRLFTQSYSGHQ
jgi:hypothetical protein